MDGAASRTARARLGAFQGYAHGCAGLKRPVREGVSRARSTALHAPGTITRKQSALRAVSYSRALFWDAKAIESGAERRHPANDYAAARERRDGRSCDRPLAASTRTPGPHKNAAAIKSPIIRPRAPPTFPNISWEIQGHAVSCESMVPPAFESAMVHIRTPATGGSPTGDPGATVAEDLASAHAGTSGRRPPPSGCVSRRPRRDG